MSSEARRRANRANAQKSTGPRTPEGKARASRNATKHGFSADLSFANDAERLEFLAFEAAVAAEICPHGPLEMDALRQFADAAWRLRKIRRYMLILRDRDGLDPLVNPDIAPTVRQLLRHRASAEMQLHRAINALRELQTLRAGRAIHLAKCENEAIGPLAAAKSFAIMQIGGLSMTRPMREAHYARSQIFEPGPPTL